MLGQQKIDLNKAIRWVLLIGVTLSIILMLIGLSLYALNPTDNDATALPVKDVFAEIVKQNPLAVIDLGILVLISTPVIRVITTTASFAADKDRIFLLISIFVLILLFVSFAIGSA